MPGRRALRLALALAAALLASACGYSFVGSGSGLPEGVRTVYLDRFLNKTRVTGLEHGVGLALRRELAGAERPRVVDRFEDADAVLSGVIRHYGTRNLSVDGADRVLQSEARLDAEVTLRRRASREVLWPRQVVRLREVYAGARGAVVPGSGEFLRDALDAADVGRMSDAVIAESSRMAARERLLLRLARVIRQRMAEGF
ncbi:MAG: LptE family protein [Deltaproteobacteria bacterium]|nr:LptE family protein [Deltaproteobacteria bacterium]